MDNSKNKSNLLNKNEVESTKKGVNNYAKYSSLGFQMFATIALGVWGGMKLDAWLNLKFPAFSVTLSVLAVVGSLVLLIKNLPKE